MRSDFSFQINAKEKRKIKNFILLNFIKFAIVYLTNKIVT